MHIDYRTITLDRIVSSDVIKINGNTISLEEETSLDERYRFSKSLSISIDGYYAIENLEKKYFIVVEDYHKNQFLVNYDFPCRVTYNYTIDDNDNRTTFNFDVLSNFPLVKLNHNLNATSEQLHCRYWIGKPHKIKMIEKDYVVLNKETKEIAISNNETFKEIEPLTFNFLESFDGNDFNTNISFTIPLDDYKSYWQYSLLEFTKNRYSMIIEPLVGENNIYVGFGEFGLMANYSISTDGDNIVTILLQTNERCYANEPFESYQDGQTFWIPISSVTTDRGEYMTSFECSSTDGYAKYLLLKEIDAFGHFTGNYKALEGYEEDYNHFINIIGTFDDEILFKHDDCKFKCQTISNIPNVIVFTSVASYTYTISSLCTWTIDNSNLPSGVTVSPLSGGSGITNVTISCSDVGASEGNYSIVLHTQDEDIPSTISVRLSKDEEYYAEIDARRQNVDFNTIFPIEYLYGDITRIIDFNVIENYIKFDIPRNDSTEERIFNIVAEDIYGSEITFHILQYGIIQEWIEEDDEYVCVGGDLYSVATLWTGYTSTELKRTNETKPYTMSVPRSEECEQYSMWQWNGDTICIDGNLYQLLTLMVSSDGYEWRETEETMAGDLIEESSLDCAENIYEINVRTKDEVGSSIWTTIVVRINGGEPMNYVNVSACTFNVAEGAEYEILFADKPNYFKPDTITATATEDKTYDAIYTTARQYNVGVTTVDEQRNYVISNITLCIDGQCRTYQSVSAITFSAPANTEFEVSFSDVQGYSTPQPIITSVTADVDYIAVYGTPKSTYDISVSSNMACDITINNVTYNNVVATSVTINSGDSYVISFSDIQGYAKPSNITGIATSDMSYSVEYTEIINTYTINVTTTDENSNPIFTRIGVAINGHAQTYPNVSGLTFNVNEGDDYIITYFAKEGYIAPSVVSVDSATSDASYVGVYQKKAEKFQIIVNPNIECDITVTINGSSTQYEDVKPLYIYLDSGDTYVIEFGEKHGYTKPNTISGIANGNKVYNVNYSELPQYTLNVYTNINTTITINGVDYVGTSATTTLYSGDSYSVSFASVSGYLAPSSVSGTIDEDTNINATYQKTYVLSVTSNMATDITINGTTYRNVASTSVTLVSGSSYSVSFGYKEGYYTPETRSGVLNNNVSISVEYIVIPHYVLSVSSNIVTDITINENTYHNITATSITFVENTSYSVSFANKEGYITPSSQTGVMDSDKSISVEYVAIPQYTLSVSSNMPCDITINGTTYSSVTATSVTMYSGTSYSISFSEIEGYVKPSNISGVLNDDVSYSVEYRVAIECTMLISSNLVTDVVVVINGVSTTYNDITTTSLTLIEGDEYEVSFETKQGYYPIPSRSGTMFGDLNIYAYYQSSVSDYLNFTARNGNAEMVLYGSTNKNTSYSFDKLNWATWDNYQRITLNNNQTIWVKGNNPNGYNTFTDYKQFLTNSGYVEANGSIQSLLYDDDFENNLTIPNTYCFYALFAGCTGLTTPPQLPATTLTQNCYSELFKGCTNLITPPTLPATTLASYCYSSMFVNCASLIQAPQLPATTLASGCYGSMFQGCTSLTTPPQLLATSLTPSCYGAMFVSCTSLTQAPQLPATTLANDCYINMFVDCTSLITAPTILPATTLTDNCYYRMFKGCSSLTTPPRISAETLANSCCFEMFINCTSLITAPELPATTLTSANSCYSGMFKGCTNLTTPPTILPATTLVIFCYQSMFENCTNLTTAPILPATSLANYCYRYMFQNCSKLNYIKAMFTVYPVDNTRDWVKGVATNGTFVKNSAAQWDDRGNSGIPSRWTVEYADS